MSVWMGPHDRTDISAAISLSASAPGCKESDLVAYARSILSHHFDPDFGAVVPATRDRIGFQYLKTADALFAAQAVAHFDFDQAATQFRRVLSHQHQNGELPLIVYGPSVNALITWFQDPHTFFPGPALWQTHSHSDDGPAKSSIMAPPIAADVAWQIYRLSPYETAMGIVGHTSEAVNFLCDVYPHLSKLHSRLFHENRRLNSTSLLTTKHPWETLSSFSSHWGKPLDRVKSCAGYKQFISEIPSSAKDRFADGASFSVTHDDAIRDLYEPMMYLASRYQNCSTTPARRPDHDCDCVLDEVDIEFNTLALRSTEALVDIGRVLLDRSSTCPEFGIGFHDLTEQVERTKRNAASLRLAITGNHSVPSPWWNESAQIFDESTHTLGQHTVRGILPMYAIQLEEHQIMGMASHLLPTSATFQFLCTAFPIPYEPCESSVSSKTIDRFSFLHYNYFVQRGFTMNQFPGLGAIVRNATREAVCASNSSGTEISVGFHSSSGIVIPFVEDQVVGSSLAAAMLLNILLPPVMPPPGPDTLPLDHRMLTVIMCVELVVAFGVALGCVFLSVYFVVNRPREPRPPRPASTNTRVSRRKRESRRDDAESEAGISSNASQSSFDSSVELEVGLLSEEEDQAYGSFAKQQPAAVNNPSATHSVWQTVTDALASISPW